MKFSELRKCPFCDNEEFYTNDRYTGSSAYHQRFDGKEAYDNSQMYDGLYHHQGAKAYCNNCFEYLGNIITDDVSKKAEKALAHQTEKGGASDA